MFFKLFIIISFIIIYYYWRNFLKLNKKKKVSKPKKSIIFNKKNLNNWMNLTKKERYNLSKQDSISYLDRRRILLTEIRKEYKKISKVKSEKKIKEK